MKHLHLLVALLLAGNLPASDWPHWRGPNYDGISHERLPDKLPKKLAVRWRANVGVGFSAVSVVGNRDGNDTIHCLDARTGRTVWRHDYPCELDPKYYEGGPSATPTIHDGSVFTLSKKGHFFSLSLKDGTVIWKRQLTKVYGFELPEWSFASSPVIDGDRVLLNVGREGTALSLHDGKALWKPSLQTAGYASFVPFKHRDSTHVLFSAKDLLGIDSVKGKVTWSHSRPSSRDVNAADPIVIGNRIIVSSSRGTELLEIGAQPKPIWNQRGLRWYFNAGVLIDEHLYSISGTTHRPTQLVCTRLATGEKVWFEDGFGSGALMAAQDKLILFDNGALTIFKANPEKFDLIHRQKILEGQCWTVPVLANGQIYCRNAAGDLACVSVR
ncbi:MAG: PQQ-binding-like beta-propeller repeat protein [Limisphaerales bacterium]